MSFFGKNIKKIRGVKGLSQQAFAELFDLKRATLGAYEEGRSEPKIETIIKIANYFSIAIDDLLTSELTVNTLLQFKGDLAVQVGTIEKESLVSIPLITEKNIADYIKYYDKTNFINDLPAIQLPLNSGKNLRAYTVVNLEMSANENGLYPNDIVVTEHFDVNELVKITQEELFLVLTDEELILRYLLFTNDDVVLKATHKNVEDKVYNKKAIKELWRVKYTFLKRVPEFKNPIEDKLFFLEREFEKLKGKM
ncbi:helix-turn-helix domain-containing protein [Tenacibaculum sp. TC6]|uniref:helix-turn-helix domain-containing protein n=1 Tax=Tenacibaculum sp. TC6 TaxID=3423223 RepID=UPI003D3635FF